MHATKNRVSPFCLQKIVCELASGQLKWKTVIVVATNLMDNLCEIPIIFHSPFPLTLFTKRSKQIQKTGDDDVEREEEAKAEEEKKKKKKRKKKEKKKKKKKQKKKKKKMKKKQE